MNSPTLNPPPAAEVETSTAVALVWYTIVVVRDGLATPVSMFLGKSRRLLYVDPIQAAEDAREASRALKEPVHVLEFKPEGARVL
ncbi:hypothetical protein [Caudoviricetes sp.]|nr:hypothetical protein [Caudoviricetes sp.]